MILRDREEAGRLLTDKLSELELRDPLVIGIPRGGMVPAAVIAEAIHADLDVVLAHKLRSPMHPELAFGAVGQDGCVHLNRYGQDLVGVQDVYLEREVRTQLDEIHRRQELFRSARPASVIADRSVILTDDGIATGSTMFAAIEVIKARDPHELIVAIPVAPPSTLQRLRQHSDQVVCLAAPENFKAVAEFYKDFHPVSDQQVVELLRRHQSPQRGTT